MAIPQRTDSMFGAACFNLTPKAKVPFTLTGADYLRQVSETLTLAQGVSDVAINAEPYFASQSYTFEEPLTPIDAGPTDFPPTDCGLWITFGVHVLARVQTELLTESLEWRLGHGVPEDFRVTLTAGFNSPVAFVEPVGPPANYDPSSAVIVVREYLKRELADHPMAPLRFEWVGPSPFHAEFRLRAFRQASPLDVRPVDWSWESKYAGYQDITITYNPAVYTNHEEAQFEIYVSLREQLSVGYYAVQKRWELWNSWERLRDEVNRLADLHRSKGVRAYAQRALSVPSSLLSATLALTDYELMEVHSLQTVREAFRSHFDHEAHPCIAKQVEELVNEVKPQPVEQFKRLIDLFDQYRAERFAGLNVLASALLGGIVGAVITAIASRIASGH